MSVKVGISGRKGSQAFGDGIRERPKQFLFISLAGSPVVGLVEEGFISAAAGEKSIIRS